MTSLVIDQRQSIWDDIKVGCTGFYNKTIYFAEDVCEKIKNTDLYKLQDKISGFSKRVFIELAIALTLNIVIMAITASPISIPVLAVTALIALVGLAVKMIFEACAEASEKPAPLENRIVEVGEVIGRVAVVNAVGLSSINIFLHEAGHAIAAKVLFLLPKIKMTVIPFGQGDTTFSTGNGLTKIGQFFGKETCIQIFRGAGLIASTVVAMVEIAIAFFLRKECPQASLTLNCHAFSQIINDVIYGFTAFSSRVFNPAHDFVNLWKISGIHPLIPIALMIGLPLIQFCALRAISYFTDSTVKSSEPLQMQAV